MKKQTALYEILEFARSEERNLLLAGKKHEAYQIEHARRTMHYALLQSVKNFKSVLDKMTEYTVDEGGFKHYDPMFFVSDEYARNLVEDFKKRLR